MSPIMEVTLRDQEDALGHRLYSSRGSGRGVHVELAWDAGRCWWTGAMELLG
jgi:hypothetical protein